jgi:hypothetical protein
MRTLLVLVPFLLLAPLAPLFAQRDVPIRNRAFQLSLAPALGTNGLHPGSFNNHISIHLTSGYAAASLLFEVAAISNLNVNRTRGWQMAGVANITGGNAFGSLTKKEREEKIKSGFAPHLSGAQLAGLTNVVMGDAFGLQLTGGVNLNKGALIGVQLSGVANVVYKYSMGVQVAGFSNTSVASFSGVQLAVFSNHTQGDMAGWQLSLFNQAGNTEGVNSSNRTQPTGLQVGLLNMARKMDGFQIGLVNIAGQSQGTQIGLVNIYKGGRQAETKDGTAIGLVNAGDVTYASVYASELFALNYELSTGTRKNGRVKLDGRNVYVTNALIFSHVAFERDAWAMGYGLKKMFFNRSELPGRAESKFIGYGIDVQHVNEESGNITRQLNLLTRLKLMAGTRLVPKLFGVNGFMSLGVQAWWTDRQNDHPSKWLVASTNMRQARVAYGPSASVGVLLH